MKFRSFAIYIIPWYADVDIGDCFNFSPALNTRGHDYKLFKNNIGIRSSCLHFPTTQLMLATRGPSSDR